VKCDVCQIHCQNTHLPRAIALALDMKNCKSSGTCGLRFRVWGLGFRVWGFGDWSLGFGVWGLGLLIWRNNEGNTYQVLRVVGNPSHVNACAAWVVKCCACT